MNNLHESHPVILNDEQVGNDERGEPVDPRLVEMLRSALIAVSRDQATRAPAEQPAKEEKKEKKEDNVPMFWKLCSAALLSVGALVAVTLYNQLSSSNGALRADVNTLRERNNELVRKDEYNQRNIAILATIQGVEANNKAAMDLWKERALRLEADAQNRNDKISKLETDLSAMRERLAAAEFQLAHAQPKEKSSPKKEK
jgi:hypothetical protein